MMHFPTLGTRKRKELLILEASQALPSRPAYNHLVKVPLAGYPLDAAVDQAAPKGHFNRDIEVVVIARTMTVLLITLSAASCAKQRTFEENYATAKENAATTAGIAYDNAVGSIIQSTPAFVLAQRECVVKNQGQPSLHGYMLIRTSADYSVVLEPKGALADCIAATFESHKLPTPPSSPYLNPVQFSAPR